MNAIEKLAEYFLKFPGIGRRQAKRFVYFLLSRDPQFRRDLVHAIGHIDEGVRQCKACFRYFPQNGHDICDVCLDISRDQGKLLVLEKDTDFETVHGTGLYDGMYFVLGGLVPINTPDNKQYIRLAQLKKRIGEGIKEKKLKEVILALSLSTEGEHTRIMVESEIQGDFGDAVKISTLGRGFSTGAEVEYSDSETLKNALEKRT